MKVNYKKVLGYLLYFWGFFILFVFVSNVNAYFHSMSNEQFRIYPWQILKVLMYFPIGVYLGLPDFLVKMKKKGKWTLNFYKIILVGLPMMYLSFYWYIPLSFPIPNVLTYTNSIFSLGTIIAGFIFINSFSKV